MFIYKRRKLDPCLIPFAKITSKWITHLTVGAKIIKLLKENIGVNICNLGLNSGFLGVKTKIQTIKEKYIYWTSSKLVY